MDAPSSSDLTARIALHLVAMEEGLIERRSAVRLALLAALAGEHVVLVGPPGTAKSEICRRLGAVFADAARFERLMTRFSVPEELFGPLSLSALERDEYVRLTDGYLPTAHVAFLDEIFKANSAILNALLTILNEREFDNGAGRVKVPLVVVVAATNEVPTEGELLALYDRFTVRCQVQPITAEAFSNLFRPAARSSPSSPRPMTLVELAELRQRAAAVPLSSGVVHLLSQLRAWLHERGIYVSDRRWLRIAGVLRVAAYTEGRSLVLFRDCLLLPALIWARPEQEAVVREWLTDHLVDLVRNEPRRFDRMVASYEAFLDDPDATLVHQRDALGRRLYRGVDGKPTHDEVGRVPSTGHDGEPLFAAPQAAGNSKSGFTANEIFRRFFSDDVDAFDAYVSDASNQVYREVELPPLMGPVRGQGFEERARQVVNLAADLAELITALREETRATDERRLWVPAETARAVRCAMAESEEALVAVFERLQRVGDRLATRARAS